MLIAGLGILERTFRMVPMDGEVVEEAGWGGWGCSVAGVGEGELEEAVSAISWNVQSSKWFVS